VPVPGVGTIGSGQNLQDLFYPVISHLQSLDNEADGVRHKGKEPEFRSQKTEMMLEVRGLRQQKGQEGCIMPPTSSEGE